jgi:hypothetical protein
MFETFHSGAKVALAFQSRIPLLRLESSLLKHWSGKQPKPYSHGFHPIVHRTFMAIFLWQSI